jgi:hypothetical protein
MTPKEKAKELFDKFTFACYECDFTQNAKDCALIAVDEIIDSYTKEKSCGYILSDKIISYWQRVKQEIQNL